MTAKTKTAYSYSADTGEYLGVEIVYPDPEEWELQVAAFVESKVGAARERLQYESTRPLNPKEIREEVVAKARSLLVDAQLKVQDDLKTLEPKHWLLPPNSTILVPPDPIAGHAVVFADGAWSLVPDLRGTRYFQGVVEHIVQELGEPIPADATDHPVIPNLEDILRESLTAVIKDVLHESSLYIDRFQEEVILGDTEPFVSEKEIKDLMRFRLLLWKVLEHPGFPNNIVWPKNPLMQDYLNAKLQMLTPQTPEG